MNATFRVLFLGLITAASLELSGQEAERWLFEGLITEADPALAPDLQSGWVLAGSFLLDRFGLEEEPLRANAPGGRLAGGIGGTELTVDLYYQLHFEASQVPGLAGFDYQNNDPENDGRDMMGWFFPVVGELKDSGWSSQWLQIWLVDPEGKLIRSVPPQISPYGLSFQSAWFRLTFSRDNGETAFADGRIDLFAPEDEAGDPDEEANWRGVAIELSDALMQKDSVIEELRRDLASSIARMGGLRNMVDLLVQERESLREENRILQEEAARADPKGQAKIVDLEVEESLRGTRIEELSEKNKALAESLASSEVERRQLLERLDVLETSGPSPVPGSGETESDGTIRSRDEKPIGTITIIGNPMVVDKPVEVKQRPVMPNPPERRPSAEARQPEPPVEEDKPFFKRRFGPRKFR